MKLFAMRSLMILFFLACFLIGRAQNYSSLISDKEIEGLIYYKVKDTVDLFMFTPVISKKILSWPKAFLEFSDSGKIAYPSIYKRYEILFLDSIFTKADKKFFLEQVDSSKKKSWELKNIRYTTKLEAKNRETYLSLPIFSINRDYAIIRQQTKCPGHCGSYDILLYKNENGRWKYYKYIIGAIF
ncbi:MAG: hypothetical protein QM737_18785 [Ferruginibacter sp.]